MPDTVSAQPMLELGDGMRVAYAVYGDPDGTPILCLHGAPACHLMFEFADGPARARGLKLIAPSRPGYGLSTMDRAPSLASRTEWLAKVVDALALERAPILALSGGAPYAVALAAELGQRVPAMALVSPMGPLADHCLSSGDEARVSRAHKTFFLSIGRKTWLTRPVSGLIAKAVKTRPEDLYHLAARLGGAADAQLLARPTVLAGMVELAQEAFRTGGHGAVADLAIYGAPWNIDWDRVTASSVLWQGTADTIVPPAAAFALARWLPNCRLVELPREGHFWVLDHMAEVLSTLTEMVGR